MSHPVMWFEVLGNNSKKLRQFYAGLFGWTFNDVPNADYGVVSTGTDRGIPGGVGGQEPSQKSWVTFYTETPDVTASLAKAQALGGKIIRPRTELPGATIGMFEDPEGHVLGLVEANPAAAQ